MPNTQRQKKKTLESTQDMRTKMGIACQQIHACIPWCNMTDFMTVVEDNTVSQL